MADLAKLVVRLEAQSSQLLTELEKANRKINGFERTTTQALDRINKKFSAFGFGIKAAIGSFLGGISFAALIKANEEAALTFANLENAVEKAGSAAGGRSADQFAKVASDIARVTTESGGAVQGVQALLLRFQNIRTDRFDDATRTVLDLAAALKKDLPEAATLVGKALANPEKGMTALAKAGVFFSDAQQKVIKDLVETGQRAEAQGIILDALQKKFGGAAEAARNNFGGVLKAVKNALGDLLESDTGLPGATGAMNDLADVLKDPAVKAGAQAIFSTLITGAAKAADLIGRTAAGLSVLFNATGDRVEELRHQIDFLENERKSLLPFVLTVGQSGLNPEGGVGVLTPGEIDARIKALKEEQDRLLGLGEAGAAAAAKVRGALEDLHGAFELPDIEIVDNTAKLAEEADKLHEKLVAAGKAMTESVRTPMEVLNDTIKRADELLAANVITLETWRRVVAKAADDVDPLLGAIARMGDEAADLSDAIDKATEDANDALAKQTDDTIEKQGEAVGKELEDIFEKADKRSSKFFDEASRNVQDILGDGIYTAIHDGFSKGAESALEAFGTMLEKMAIQAVAAHIADKIFGGEGVGSGGGIFGGGGGGGGGGIGGLLGGGFGGGILNFFGGLFRDQGGRGEAGVPYMIGRGAQPEVFVPDTAGEFFPRDQWMGAGGARITQNIYTDGPMTARTARQLALESERAQRTAAARFG